MQKGRMQVFGLFHFFCRIELIFHRLTCFDMKHIVPQLSWWICASFSRNNVCKKLSFPLETFCSTRNKRNLLFHLDLLPTSQPSEDARLVRRQRIVLQRIAYVLQLIFGFS